MRDFFMQLQDTTPWIWTGAAACVVLVIVLLGMRVVHSLVLRATSHHTMFGLIVRRAHAPLTVVVAVAALNLVWPAAPDEMSLIGAVRSEGGRVGKGCVSAGRSRVSPYH